MTLPGATARHLDAALRGVDQPAALRRFSAALSALEAALSVCIEDPDAHGTVALVLVGALSRGWWMQGQGAHGAVLAERVLTAVPDGPDAAMGAALHGDGALAQSVGAYRRAAVLHRGSSAQALTAPRQPGRQGL